MNSGRKISPYWKIWCVVTVPENSCLHQRTKTIAPQESWSKPKGRHLVKRTSLDIRPAHPCASLKHGSLLKIDSRNNSALLGKFISQGNLDRIPANKIQDKVLIAFHSAKRMQQNMNHPCNVFHPVPYLGSMSLPLLPSVSKALQEKINSGEKRSVCNTGWYF